MGTTTRWPALPVAAWQDTRDTLQLYTQVVGKVRMANEPLTNHWWNVPLYVTARGLTTSLMPHPTGPSFQIDIDVLAHRLEVSTVDGGRRELALEPRTVADFYAAVMGMLDELGVPTTIWPMPVEVAGAVRFPDDREHASYDPDAVRRFWQALVEMTRVFAVFRGRFLGKASPVHLFWGGLDLAHTRFSGRTAPPHPGGSPNCGPQVMHEAYSHEVSSCGYWPGPPGQEGVFYAYAYPEPPGYREKAVRPAGARWDDGLQEFVLPYELVRAAADPDAFLLEFLQTTYEAAATTASWDRMALERTPAPGSRAPMATAGARAQAQLRTIAWLHERLAEQGIDYWLFGGWAVDFHARRITRDHADIDIAVWSADLGRIRTLLEAEGWSHAPEPGEDGYTGYERAGTRLELAFLARKEAGTVDTPLAEGRGEWPAGSFGDERAEVNGVLARVVGLTSLVEDKSGPRTDPAVAAKDRADVTLLRSLRTAG